MTVNVQDATSTHDCKWPGCTNEARGKYGRHAYCEEHQGRGGRPGGRGSGGDKKPAEGGAEQRIRTLAKLAREVDRAKAHAQRKSIEAIHATNAAREKEQEFQRLAREVIGDAS